MSPSTIGQFHKFNTTTLDTHVSVQISEVARIESRINVLGQSLNSHICKIIGLSCAANLIWLNSEETEETFMVQNAHLSKCRVRLKQMTSHEGLFVLKCCLGIPCFLFLIHTACCIGLPTSAAFDSLLRDMLGDVKNTVIDD